MFDYPTRLTITYKDRVSDGRTRVSAVELPAGCDWKLLTETWATEIGRVHQVLQITIKSSDGFTIAASNRDYSPISHVLSGIMEKALRLFSSTKVPETQPIGDTDIMIDEDGDIIKW